MLKADAMTATLAVLTFTLAGSLFAQEFRATVTGSVTDSSGAKMAGVKIDVRNLATGVNVATTTNGDGLFQTPFLSPGSYNISATASGFKSAVKENVELRVGDRLQSDFVMQVGQISEQVTVEASAEQLETGSADLGQVIGAKATAELPLLGRNPFQLTTLSAGVQHIPTLASRSDRPFDNGGMDSYNINGSRTFTNEFLLDGTPNTSSEGNTSPNNLTLAPPPDAVSESKVQTSSYDAQYGRTGGGTVNVTLKSGTNRFHGNLYDYWRNTVLNANTFDANLSGQGKVPFHWNEPGAEVDGPVFIPKLYDGRNRTFFMYNWEDIRSSVPYPQTYTVPTAAERNGDFSNLLNASGGRVTVFDPLSTVRNANGTYTRSPFPGNRLPANRIDPVAKNMLAYLPLPNAIGNGFGQNNFTAPSNSRSDKYDIHTFRLDHSFSDKNKAFFDVLRSNRHEVNGYAGYTGPASPLYLHWRTNTGVIADLTTIASPTLVIDSRMSFNRHVFAIARHSSGFDPTQLGFPSSFVGQLGTVSFPQIVMSPYFNSPACNCFGYTGSVYTATNTFSWTETLSKTLSSHAIKAGANFRIIRNNAANPTSSAGSFTFNNAFTQQNPLQADALSGDAFASFLLGTPASGSVPVNPALAYQNVYYAVFLQDDWRVNSRLTVNLGVRWDYETPTKERFFRQNRGFDYGALSPLQVPGFRTLYGGLQFTDGVNRYPFSPDFNNVQPRAGFAYKITPSTVFRGGYGLSYLPTFDIGNTNGYSTSTGFVSSTDGGLTPANYLSNPFPGGVIQPAGSSLGLGTLLGQGFLFANGSRKIPYVHQFSGQLQQQLPWRMLFSVGYAGSRTYDLQVAKGVNAIPAASLGLGSNLLSPVTNPFAGRLPGSNINGATVPLQQLLLPFPQFAGLTQNNNSFGSSSYDSLQVTLEKRFSGGLFFTGSYTYSRAMESTMYLNPQDSFSSLARFLSPFDAPHRFTLNAGYTLPFFKTNAGWKSAVLGGWQLNGIAYFQSGVPIPAPTSSGGNFPGVNTSGSTTYSGGAVSTGINPYLGNVGALDTQFNTCTITLTGARQNCSSPSQAAAWRVQSPFELTTLGVAMPGSIRTHRPPQIHFSVFKTFNFTEYVHLQFRAEFFNLANTPWFGGPNTAINSPQFGQVTKLQTNDARSGQLALRLSF